METKKFESTAECDKFLDNVLDNIGKGIVVMENSIDGVDKLAVAYRCSSLLMATMIKRLIDDFPNEYYAALAAKVHEEVLAAKVHEEVLAAKVHEEVLAAKVHEEMEKIEIGKPETETLQ